METVQIKVSSYHKTTFKLELYRLVAVMPVGTVFTLNEIEQQIPSFSYLIKYIRELCTLGVIVRIVDGYRRADVAVEFVRAGKVIDANKDIQEQQEKKRKYYESAKRIQDFLCGRLGARYYAG